MATTYTCRDGDTLDRVMWLAYETQSDDLLNGLLEANPGIADDGPVLSAGTVVIIPDADTTETATTSEVRLWD